MSDEIDILQQINDVDLATVETSYPIAKGGVVQAIVNDIEFVDNKDKTGKSAAIKYSLNQPWETVPDENGKVKEIKPGYIVSESIWLMPWTDPKTNEVKNFGLQRLAQLREAILGKAQPGAKFRKEELIGQPITLRLVYNPAPSNKKTGEVFGPRTEVSSYVRKAK